jgi:hypothetical protein
MFERREREGFKFTVREGAPFTIEMADERVPW